MILNVVQIIISALLVIVILFQQKSSGGLGASFGGSDSTGYRTKRGFEKKLFIITIILAGLFICTAFARLLIK